MQLREFAEQMRQLRISTINSPESASFVINNGTWLRAMDVETYYEVNGLRTPIGICQLFYVDIDSHARSPEAQLVRAGVWEPWEAGWLIASIKGVSIPLAKVTPTEKINIDNGWVTSSGQLILKRDI